MRFAETPLTGAFVIDLEPSVDKRGFFARAWCEREFANHGLVTRSVQSSISYNARAGTVRGMHYQVDPYPEVKVVRCTAGAIFDVIIDLRPHSPTFAQHFAITLSAANRKQLYIPCHFAHGFQTLEDGTEVTYHMSEFYHPECARGVRWNDPAFGIVWPAVEVRHMAERDATYPDFIDARRDA